ncbi:MAG: IPT/TIG domain-containing protein, partial [Acidimicrobiales bacterium]
PGDEVGDVGVVVRTYGGETASLAFLILPSVTVVSPPGGPLAGGTVVTITGSGFDTAAGGTAISFGSTPATAVGCASASTCTAVSPPGTGTVDVRVTAHGGTSPIGPADTFTYRSSIGEEPTTTTTTTAAPTTTTTVVGNTYTQPTTTAVTPAFTG